MISVSDGYTNSTTRDTTGLVGGAPGYVNSARYTVTITGLNQTSFEWNSVDILNNYADAGENVAHYAQANKHGKGWTGARCAETCSTEPLAGAQITDEVDCWVSGPSTGDKGCMDLVVGDGKFIRSKGVERSDVAEIFFAQRTAATLSTPWARFVYGYIIGFFKECGILLDSTATRAIQLKGTYVVGLDCSTSTCQEAIRLAPGQSMSFEPTGQIKWSWLNGRLRVQNGAMSVLEIDTSTGDIYKKGVKVL